MTTGEVIAGFETPDSTGEESSTEESALATEQEADSDIDWKARYEAEALAKTKVENDLKSQRNGRQTADDRQQALLTRMDNLAEEQTLSRRQSEAMMKAIASGDTDALPQQMEELNQAHATQQASDSLVGQANSLHSQIIDAVIPAAGGDREAAIKMIETLPEYQSIRDGWSTHAQEGNLNIVALAGVAAQAAGISVRLVQEQSVQAVQNAQAQAAQTLEEADVLDLGTGGGTPAPSTSDETRHLQLANPEYIWTPDDKVWYTAYRRTQGLR